MKRKKKHMTLEFVVISFFNVKNFECDELNGFLQKRRHSILETLQNGISVTNEWMNLVSSEKVEKNTKANGKP